MFTASRPDARGTPLLIHQLQATLRSYGARLAHLRIESDEQSPDYLLGGRGTVDLEGSDSTRLARQVTEHLWAEFGEEASW